jgi:uroporphyrinogen-III decarboxylase
MPVYTSRQRLLDAIELQEPDHIPCCFMSFAILRKRFKEDLYNLALAEKELGLDPMMFIPTASRQDRREHPDLRGLPIRFDPLVNTIVFREGDILYKEYQTPEGTLTTSVHISTDWPHGNLIPFIDDYQIPRAIKPLITGPDDLPALQYLLIPPTKEDIAAFMKEAISAKAFTNDKGFLLAGGWGVGSDMANWLCGMKNLMVFYASQPDFVIRLLEMIHQWNIQRMRVLLDSGIDLFIRRGWYEGCDFILPRFYRNMVLPLLKAEVDLAHNHNVKFGYICTSGTRPLLENYLEAGIDTLIGIDPIQGTNTDIHLMKEKLGSKICLWGGVSGAITVENGSEEEVRQAVRLAINNLGPSNFVLSPVDNITEDTPKTWKNINYLIDEWKCNW